MMTAHVVCLGIMFMKTGHLDTQKLIPDMTIFLSENNDIQIYSTEGSEGSERTHTICKINEYCNRYNNQVKMVMLIDLFSIGG